MILTEETWAPESKVLQLKSKRAMDLFNAEDLDGLLRSLG